MAFIWYVCKLTLLLGCVSRLCVCLKWSEHSRTHFKPSGGHDNPTWSEKVDLQSFNRSVPVSPADESQPPVLSQLLSFNSFVRPFIPAPSPFSASKAHQNYLASGLGWIWHNTVYLVSNTHCYIMEFIACTTVKTDISGMYHVAYHILWQWQIRYV